MNIEQRLAAVEKALADLTTQQKTAEELSRLMREAATSAIKSAQRPGGCLYRLGDGKAAISQAADYTVKIGVNYDADREGALDYVATVLRESPVL